MIDFLINNYNELRFLTYHKENLYEKLLSLETKNIIMNIKSFHYKRLKIDNIINNKMDEIAIIIIIRMKKDFGIVIYTCEDEKIKKSYKYGYSKPDLVNWFELPGFNTPDKK